MIAYPQCSIIDTFLGMYVHSSLEAFSIEFQPFLLIRLNASCYKVPLPEQNVSGRGWQVRVGVEISRKNNKARGHYYYNYIIINKQTHYIMRKSWPPCNTLFALVRPRRCLPWHLRYYSICCHFSATSALYLSLSLLQANGPITVISHILSCYRALIITASALQILQTSCVEILK